jgi:DNA repair protein RadD
VPLRPYQLALYQRTREAFRQFDRVFMQLPTGGGKTAIVAEMIKSASSRGWNTWAVVPRNELLTQMSETLLGIGVKHGIIAAGRYESAAYDVHVVSKDTLTRRLERHDVKRPPQFMIIDEAHLALDRYIEFARAFSDMGAASGEQLGIGERRIRMLGISATPERLDGRGLSELYQALVEGPTVPELVDAGYLSDVRYFCPPIVGLENVHRRGTDYDEAELDALLATRKVYGSAIEHYRRHADGKPALVYCRSVKAAEETAHRFCAAGYKFENIDGTMSYQRRRALIDGLKAGEIDGLTSCELITYGLDVPRVECVIMLRPTLSRTTYCQQIGRGLRPWSGKRELVVLDHVGNLQEHGHPFAPHVWNFEGCEKRPRSTSPEVVARLCPALDFLYCQRRSCAGCEHAEDGKDPRRPLETVDKDLVEAPRPVPLGERPPMEQVEIEQRIAAAVREFAAEATRDRVASGPVSRLLEVAEELGRKAEWVYWELSKDRQSVNVPLLYEIARVKGYKPGWAYWKKKDIEQRIRKGPIRALPRVRREEAVR